MRRLNYAMVLTAKLALRKKLTEVRKNGDMWWVRGCEMGTVCCVCLRFTVRQYCSVVGFASCCR